MKLVLLLQLKLPIKNKYHPQWLGNRLTLEQTRERLINLSGRKNLKG
jgi:hypothetical protein